ncbi:hypothetical protein J6Y73_01605 [bacterium]|nr:hypothetical protein [bacterium]
MYSYLENQKFVNKTLRWGQDLALSIEKKLEEKNIKAEVDVVDETIILMNESLNQSEFPYIIKVFTTDKFTEENLNQVKESINEAFNDLELKPIEDFALSFKTKRMHWLKEPSNSFTFEFFIITENNGNYSRVALKKNTLVELPMMKKEDLDKKEGKLKGTRMNEEEKNKKDKDYQSNRMWEVVTTSYLNKLNMYEKRGDKNHPSFVCFIESINEVYYRNYEQ